MSDPIEDPDVASGTTPASGVELDYEPSGEAEDDPEAESEPAGS